MTIAQYKDLNETEQLILLCTEGVDLQCARHTSNFVVRLFGLADFYVELFFQKTSSLPFQLCVLENTAQLEPYLEAIDLEVLLTEN
jgi:hypothetical protein